MLHTAVYPSRTDSCVACRNRSCSTVLTFSTARDLGSCPPCHVDPLAHQKYAGKPILYPAHAREAKVVYRKLIWLGVKFQTAASNFLDGFA